VIWRVLFPIELFFGGGLPGQYVAGDTSGIPLTTQPGTHRLPSEMRMLLLATVLSQQLTAG